VSNGMDPAQVASLQTALDLACRLGIVVVLIVWILNFGAELWRMVRSLGSAPRNGGPSSARAA
jgi:hypothetical protein